MAGKKRSGKRSSPKRGIKRGSSCGCTVKKCASLAKRSASARTAAAHRQAKREAASMGPHITPAMRRKRALHEIEEGLRAKYGGDASRKRKFGKKKASSAHGRKHRSAHTTVHHAPKMSSWGYRDWPKAPISHARASVLGWQRRFKKKHKRGPKDKSAFGGHRHPVLFHPKKAASRDASYRDWPKAPISHARASVLGWQRRFKKKHKRGPKDKRAFGGHRHPVLFHPRGY